MKSNPTVSRFRVLVSLPLIVFALVGCGGTSVGNPQVDLKFANYTALNFLDWLIPSAFAALSNGKICIRQLRFKADAGSAASGGNIDFQPGEISLAVNGTSAIGRVSVPPGVYGRVEFDLTRDGLGCTSGNSVSFTNANGAYTSTDSTTIKFEGSFVASQAVQTLSLGLQGIVDALNTISGTSGYNSSIAGTLQNASVKGNF